MSDSIKDEIDDMLDGMIQPEVDVVEEETSEEVIDESSDSSEGEEQADTESGEEELEEEVSVQKDEEPDESEGEVVEGEEKTSKKKREEIDSEDPDEESLPDEAAELRTTVNEMSALLLKHNIQLPGIEVPKVESETPVPVPVPVTPLTMEDLVILEEGVDFDSMMDNPQAYTEAQRSMLQRHGALMQQEIMRNIPNIVAAQVKQVTALNSAVDLFYSENEDLAAVRPTVGAVANRIVAANPDWALDKVLDEAAKTTRKVLKMPEVSGKLRKIVKPSFAKSKGRNVRAPKPKISKLQSDIDSLLD